MSTYHGQQDFSGPKKGRKNKGVAAVTRDRKRVEAEERNKHTPEIRTRKWRREADEWIDFLVQDIANQAV